MKSMYIMSYNIEKKIQKKYDLHRGDILRNEENA